MTQTSEESAPAVPPSGAGPLPVGDPGTAAPPGRPRLTVLVPTRDEAENAAALLRRLGAAVAGLGAEILVVDDSDDGTAAILRAHAADCPVPVIVRERPRGARTGGLSGAVMEGLRQARGQWILVMDGDLQHPPEAAGALARTAMRHSVDIVVGTRYAGAGSADEGFDAGRALGSSGATRLAKTLFPRRLSTISDPMSGFFVFRRDAVDPRRLHPVGFKILLEILVRHPAARVAEMTYDMATRESGRSKATVGEATTYLRHLARLRRDRLRGQLREAPRTRAERLRQLGRMVSFGLVGLSGIGVNTAVLWCLYEVLGLNHLLGAALATQASTTWNFLLTDGLVFRRHRAGTAAGRAARFFAMNNLLLIARLPVLQVLVWAGVGVLAANALTLAMLFLVRFLVSDRVIYQRREPSGRDPVRLLVEQDTAAPVPAASRKRSTYLTYRYDVAGTVTIGSQILLPELEFFRAQWVPDDDVDIAIRTGSVGDRGLRRRAAMTEYSHPTTMRYEEHLGRLGANFRVTFDERIDITVGPLLARSPHVVYTNIVEALLRFLLVARDRMLLHSACVELDGVGVMLSALTDTGKTATVLRLLRDHGGRFLSDDMTVVDADGTAICFPKPLTISSHTLRAVQADDLTPREWRRLQLQSRLHSKDGRTLALSLARWNVPIMSINAVTQMLVPPPKYSVDRLVSCRMGSSTTVDELFIIERGRPGLRDIDRAATLERMIENTEDAYGFPPFRYLAPSIRIGGRTSAELREREREILAGFLSHVRTRVLASDSFGWADEIPRLLATGTGRAVPAQRRPARRADLAWPHWGGPVVSPPARHA